MDGVNHFLLVSIVARILRSGNGLARFEALFLECGKKACLDGRMNGGNGNT